MNTKWIVAVLGVVAVLLIGWALFMSLNASNTSSTLPMTTTSPSPIEATSTMASTSATGSKTYTLADVGTHNSAASCWTAINGNVYDVTSWISKHPGGPDHIIALCGTDGSAAFNGQHGGQAQPAAMLATFSVGTLAQ
jgi:cytochrome b involved in lipid metabolism